MRLFAVSKPHVNHPFHMGYIPGLRIDGGGKLRKSSTLTTQLYFPFRM